MSITDQIKQIQQALNACETQALRPKNSVTLLAVSKKQPISAIQEAYDAGVHDFAENYLQESIEKIDALAHLDITWHFIGPIQSNKAAKIAERFDWVHSVSRGKIAQILNDHRPVNKKPLQVCLQVHFSDDNKKSGVCPEELSDLIRLVCQLPNLQLRGLMCILSQHLNKDEQYLRFKTLSDLLKHYNSEFQLSMDTLSMGMSTDYPIAIRAGSTMVRIGTAIFGERS